MLHNPFYEVALLLLVASLVGAVAVRLRQPLIIAFIVVGILVGPSAFNIIDPGELWGLLAELGIALLLFVVGLKLDVQLVRRMGPTALATGLGQVAFTSGVGFVVARALGLEPVAALYVAVALTFSSTIIIVKLLSDKREIDALHGRIAVGFLIVQDLVVVLAMIILTAVGEGSDRNPLLEALAVGLRGLLFLGGTFVLALLLPRLLHLLARSAELLVLFAVAWAVALGAAGDLLGFSAEVGAFLAGVSLASTPNREAIASRLVSLRDFLLLFFFIDLGAGLELGLLGAQVVPALVLSAFVLVGNPLIVMLIMRWLGYRKRTGFLAGLTVAQISEFSLILAALGASLGHIGRDTVGLITLVGLITIALSTYLILYSNELYARLAPLLSPFERRVPFRESEGDANAGARGADALVFGLGRFGGRLLRELRKGGLEVHGVDFDPETVRRWRAAGVTAHYGDAEDPEYPGTLALSGVRWVVSSIPYPEVNLALLHGLRHHGYGGRVAVTAHHRAAGDALRAAGADLVLFPFKDAAERAAQEVLARTREAAPLR
jgi:Kef-type K+ transport system membrane component KefB